MILKTWCRSEIRTWSVVVNSKHWGHNSCVSHPFGKRSMSNSWALGDYVCKLRFYYWKSVNWSTRV